MKRFLICMLAILLVLPLSAVRADTNPMRSLTLLSEAEGDVLDVRFFAEIDYPSDTAAFESLDFKLTFSKDVLELIEFVKIDGVPESEIIDDSFFGQELTNVSGSFEYHCASAFGHRGSGLLLHLRFRILKEGAYGFRTLRDGYSIYDASTNQSVSYHLPSLRQDSAQQNTPLPDVPLPTKKPDASGSEQPEQTKGWFARLIDSIFGSSCTGGK